MHLVLQGVIIGFLTATPIGPVGMLCLRTTLKRGKITGILSGLGIAAAYAIASYITMRGLHLLASGILQEHHLIRFAGGLIICFVGVRNMKYTPCKEMVKHNYRRCIGSFFVPFFLAITNPVTFLSFSMIFSITGLGNHAVCCLPATQVALSIFSGATVFWLIVSHIISRIRSRTNSDIIRRVHHVSSCCILVAGLGIVISSFF